jgi:hypothetical protein
VPSRIFPATAFCHDAAAQADGVGTSGVSGVAGVFALSIAEASFVKI